MLYVRRFAAAALAAGAVAFAVPAEAQQLRLLTSWDSTYLGTEHIAKPFAEKVEQATGGEVTLMLSGPETVPPFEQLQPVQAGAFQLLFTHGAYHSGTTGIGMALDAVEPDPQRRRDTGLWDRVDEIYQDLGLKLIALPSASEGYHVILREPVGESGDLAGRKLTWMFFSWVKLSSSSSDSSRPMPDCLKPPKGAPRKCFETSLIQI